MLFEPLLRGLQQQLEKDDYEMVRDLLCTYSNVFAGPEGPLGHTHLIEHEIETGGHPPIRQPVQKYSVADMDAN